MTAIRSMTESIVGPIWGKANPKKKEDDKKKKGVWVRRRQGMRMRDKASSRGKKDKLTTE